MISIAFSRRERLPAGHGGSTTDPYERHASEKSRKPLEKQKNLQTTTCFGYLDYHGDGECMGAQKAPTSPGTNPRFGINQSSWSTWWGLYAPPYASPCAFSIALLPRAVMSIKAGRGAAGGPRPVAGDSQPPSPSSSADNSVSNSGEVTFVRLVLLARLTGRPGSSSMASLRATVAASLDAAASLLLAALATRTIFLRAAFANHDDF